MSPARLTRRALLGLAAVAIAAVALTAGQPAAPPSHPADAFVVRDAMVPMRDGAKLFTKIFTPKNQTGPLPFVFRRTPYGIDGAAGSFTRYYKALADEGYIFVFQDIRGKFTSEGEFVMQRPARAPGDTTSLDEGTDTFDTIEWLLENVPQHNGRVGMLGVSLRRLDHHHGRDRAASGPQGDLAAGLAGRHVARRRLPSQRRLPPELRFRVRHDDGIRQGREELRVRSLRHLRLVPVARPAQRHQPQVPAGVDSDLERLRPPSRLRRVLEAPDAGAAHPLA